MKKVVFVILLVGLTSIVFSACTNTPIAETDVLSASEVTLATDTIQTTESLETETEKAPLADGEIIVTSLDELQTAMADTEISVIRIGSDIETTEVVNVEREDDLSIYIENGTTLIVTEDFTVVGCIVQNDGTMMINGTFQRGISNLINNGTITVKSGGKMGAGMSTTDNNGTIIVEADGEMTIEQGSIFNNNVSLVNNGYIPVSDGGQLNDMGGTIVNDGTIDLSSFFNGDITLITGSGIVNDMR